MYVLHILTAGHKPASYSAIGKTGGDHGAYAWSTPERTVLLGT